jgi:hypothetical protein
MKGKELSLKTTAKQEKTRKKNPRLEMQGQGTGRGRGRGRPVASGGNAAPSALNHELIALGSKTHLPHFELGILTSEHLRIAGSTARPRREVAPPSRPSQQQQQQQPPQQALPKRRVPGAAVAPPPPNASKVRAQPPHLACLPPLSLLSHCACVPRASCRVVLCRWLHATRVQFVSGVPDGA